MTLLVHFSLCTHDCILLSRSPNLLNSISLFVVMSPVSIQSPYEGRIPLCIQENNNDTESSMLQLESLLTMSYRNR